jgi:ubiquinone/menaquinone biosynthesis C-methylase UbiE
LFQDATCPRASEQDLAAFLPHLTGDVSLALDVMCGCGRVLVPCVERGAKVHGVDRSPAMLALCEAKLASHGLAATLFRQDAVDLNVPFRYGAAFIAGGAFGLVSDPLAARAALERIRAHLVPPGMLVVECRIPDSAQQRLAAPLVEVTEVKLADGSRIVRRSETTWTPEAKLARAQHRYPPRRGNERLGEEHETIVATWYEREEIAGLVREAGFGTVAIEEWPGETAMSDAFLVSARSA